MNIRDHANEMKTYREILSSGPIDNYRNYGGDIVPDTHVFVYSKNRDSKGLEECNYRCILKELSALPDDTNTDIDYPIVYEHVMHHWAVGVLTYLFVKKGTAQQLKAAEILCSLESDNPIWDEGEYCAHVCSKCGVYFEELLSEFCDSCQKEYDEKQIEDLIESISEGNGCLLVYDKHKNCFDCIEIADVPYIDWELSDLIKDGKLYEVIVDVKRVIKTFYTIVERDGKEALDDVDNYLHGQYGTAIVGKVTI